MASTLTSQVRPARGLRSSGAAGTRPGGTGFSSGGAHEEDSSDSRPRRLVGRRLIEHCLIERCQFAGVHFGLGVGLFRRDAGHHQADLVAGGAGRQDRR